MVGYGQWKYRNTSYGWNQLWKYGEYHVCILAHGGCELCGGAGFAKTGCAVIERGK